MDREKKERKKVYVKENERSRYWKEITKERTNLEEKEKVMKTEKKKV